jgi:hypothetical protein
MSNQQVHEHPHFKAFQSLLGRCKRPSETSRGGRSTRWRRFILRARSFSWPPLNLGILLPSDLRGPLPDRPVALDSLWMSLPTSSLDANWPRQASISSRHHSTSGESSTSTYSTASSSGLEKVPSNRRAFPRFCTRTEERGTNLSSCSTRSPRLF